MTTPLNKFIGLSFSRKVLLIQTMCLSAYTCILFAFFKRFARFGTKTSADSNIQLPDKIAYDIAWSIQAVAKRISWKNVCRHQAYQAKLLCNYYKIPYLIFIGFKKDKNNGEIQAHAWTLAGGKMITGLCNPNEYIVQTIYKNKW